MRISTVSSIALAAVMALAGAAAAVSPASAAPTKQLSDSAYLAASRCAGIAEGLGSDTTAIQKALVDQDSGREPFIVDRATSRREDAARAARHAGPDTKGHLTAEWSGACQAYIG